MKDRITLRNRIAQRKTIEDDQSLPTYARRRAARRRKELEQELSDSVPTPVGLTNGPIPSIDQATGFQRLAESIKR